MDFKYIKEFSPRTKLSQPVYERVVKRWKDLGFDWNPPKVNVFEEQTADGERGWGRGTGDFASLALEE